MEPRLAESHTPGHFPHPARRFPQVARILEQAGLFRAVLVILELPEGAFPVALGDPCGIAAWEDPHRPLLDRPDCGAHPVEQRAVVGDEHHRAAVPAELLLQRLDAVEVEVGGRLVGEEQRVPA